MASFLPRKMHGGRTSADLPAEFINSREDGGECPEHQEFYYHSENGMSMIIEIEGRFESPEPPASSSSAEPQSDDLQAVDYHLQNLAEDEGPCTILTPAHKIQMGKLDAPAYRLHARIELADDPDEAEEQEKAVTSCHMLLARLEKQGADLIVWVNVPGVKIGDSSVEKAVDDRDDIASSILDRFGESFALEGSDQWSVVEDGFKASSEHGLVMSVDQKMGERNNSEGQGKNVELIVPGGRRALDETLSSKATSEPKPLTLKSGIYKGIVFDLADRVMNDSAIPLSLDEEMGVWGELTWGNLDLVFFLSKPPQNIYRSEEDRCLCEWRSVCEGVVRNGTGHINFNDGTIEGTFPGVIAGNEGKLQECHFLGERDHDLAPKPVGEIRDRWNSLGKEA
ncbi:hypothetical protein FQN54_005632 [Arachnomyces sp. PD_36]|nr:hypothetical protein FQN54_005632 [Arachnomyces sp. PD_36]